MGSANYSSHRTVLVLEVQGRVGLWTAIIQAPIIHLPPRSVLNHSQLQLRTTLSGVIAAPSPGAFSTWQ